MMPNEELGKARAELRGLCDMALLSSIANVTYVSGYEVPHAVGVSAVTVSRPAGSPLSRCAKRRVGWAYRAGMRTSAAESRLDGVLTFEGFDSFMPTVARGTYLAAVRDALANAGLGQSGTLGH